MRVLGGANKDERTKEKGERETRGIRAPTSRPKLELRLARETGDEWNRAEAIGGERELHFRDLSTFFKAAACISMHPDTASPNSRLVTWNSNVADRKARIVRGLRCLRRLSPSSLGFSLLLNSSRLGRAGPMYRILLRLCYKK